MECAHSGRVVLCLGGACGGLSGTGEPANGSRRRAVFLVCTCLVVVQGCHGPTLAEDDADGESGHHEEEEGEDD